MLTELDTLLENLARAVTGGSSRMSLKKGAVPLSRRTSRKPRLAAGVESREKGQSMTSRLFKRRSRL